MFGSGELTLRFILTWIHVWWNWFLTSLWQHRFKNTGPFCKSHLEAQLLSTGIHRSSLAHTWRSCNQQGVTQWVLSAIVWSSFTLEVSTIPWLCSKGYLLLFQKSQAWNKKRITCLTEQSFTVKNQFIPLRFSCCFFSSICLSLSRAALSFHFLNQLNSKKKTSIKGLLSWCWLQKTN